MINLIFSQLRKMVGLRRPWDHIDIGIKNSITTDCRFQKGVRIGNYCVLSALRIGYGSYISDRSTINNATIGNYCSLGPELMAGLGEHPSSTFVTTHPAFFSTQGQSGVVFADRNYFNELKKITIGNDVWIGARVFIKDGVSIGNGAIIGAGAVVVKDVPPYAIVVGVPAKVIKYRFSPTEIKYLLKLDWWNKPPSWLKKHWRSFHNLKKLRIISV